MLSHIVNCASITMKTLIITVVLAAIAFAEPPPAKSYLPPATTRSTGYPKGPQPQGQNFASGAAPQVVAARNLNLGAHEHAHAHGSAAGNDFARSSQASAKFAASAEQGYESSSASFARNALEEASAEPANYNFGYMVNDYQEGTDFGHHEERQEERAQGEYHVVLPDGRKQTVSYEADERGFKPQISYEESEANGRAGGYDSNANNVRSNGVGNHGNGYDDSHHGNGYDSANPRSNGY